jgi:hypothetical protein
MLISLIGFAPPARADFIGSVQIDFQTGNQAGSYAVILPPNQDPITWILSNPISVYGDEPGTVLGTIRSLDVELNGDPGVSLGFNVTAGAAPTHITVTSALVTFAPLVNPPSFASAAMTVTDTDSDGANVTGLFPGSMAYQALFNGSSVFANLVAPISAGVDTSASFSDRWPIAGMIAIPGAVSSIQTQFDFLLSANDTASGTSFFNVLVVPEPSSLALAALAGAMGTAITRRRSKKWGHRPRGTCPTTSRGESGVAR